MLTRAWFDKRAGPERRTQRRRWAAPRSRRPTR